MNSRGRSFFSRLLPWVGLTLAVLAAFIVAAWAVLQASVPRVAGTVHLTELAAPVTIARDAAGVPVIRARTREDLARALGYAHAQDRYFQMDLLRRAAAGELSALLGPGLLETDQRLRLHRFRTVAAEVVRNLPPAQRGVLDAYVAGVNAGLVALQSRPPEYWLLRSRPLPWRAEDSILCIFTMYLQLQDAAGSAELQRGLLRSALPAALAAFLAAPAAQWDAAADGSTDPEPTIPSAAELDLRQWPSPLAADAADGRAPREPGARLGSNNWAVAGAHTATAAAIVANDMHLGYRVPNIWYRARLVQESPPALLDETGVTLPGTPTVIAGSNGSIAWGFTNSYGQFGTVVRLVDAGAQQRLRYVDETIEVAGGTAEHLRVALSPWGPIMGRDWDGKPYAYRWTAHEAAATNLNVLELEQLRTVHDALRAAPTFGIPGQNFMVGDAQGHIGWTIAGRLPRRDAGAPDLPRSSDDAGMAPIDWLPAEQYPRIEDPPAGLLWSANARVVGAAARAIVGDDGMDRGARAGQIRDDLRAAVGLAPAVGAPPGASPPSPADAAAFTPLGSLAVQLDDRALFLERWRGLLDEFVRRTDTATPPRHQGVRDTLRLWTGRAAPADPAYRLVAAFRTQVEARVFDMLTEPARRAAPEFRFVIPSSFEGPLWQLLQARPPHLLARRYPQWDALLLAALDEAERLAPGCRSLPTCTWDEVNRARIAHPLSRAVPWLARWLDMPAVALAGGREDMPRIQGGEYGASERFSVSPGHEGEAYFHMPGAQSGNPLSPYYRAGFAAWAEGAPAPFLPGPAVHTLTLRP